LVVNDGIEITAPSLLDVTGMNRLLTGLGQEPALSEDLAPLGAAQGGGPCSA